jgi:hypothetical protein
MSDARSRASGAVTVLPVEDRTLEGIGLVLLALLAFTCLDTCAKWLVLHGVPAAEVVFVRYAVHLGIVTVIGVASAERLWLSANPWAVSLRGGGSARKHDAQLRSAAVPAADHDLGADVQCPAVDLPAVDPDPG